MKTRRLAVIVLALSLSAQAVGCSDDGADNQPNHGVQDAGADVDGQDSGVADAEQDVADAADADEQTDASDATGGPDATDASDASEDGGDTSGLADAGSDAAADTGGDVGPTPMPPDNLDPTGGSWSPDYSMAGLQGTTGSRGYVLAEDPNGAGFYVGGDFDVAGGAAASHIAHWTGSKWEAVGTSSLAVKVHALAVSAGGSIYAGGEGGGGGIGIGGSNSIEKWDGSSWSTWVDIGGGFGTVVEDIEILSDGRIAVGGEFGTVDSQSVDNLAVFDGSGWTQLGGVGPDGRVRDIVEMSDGRICIGGDFANVGQVTVNRIACWDGAQWQPLGNGMNSGVDVLLEDSGDLLAGGTFSVPDGNGGSSIGLGRWDGTSWKGIGGGVGGGSVTDVRSLAIGPSGELFVGGTFSNANGFSGGTAVSNIAMYDGSQWHSLGSGVVNTIGFTGGGVVGPNDLLVDAEDGTLTATGLFSVVGDKFSLNIGQWQIGATDDTGWSKLVGTGEFAGADMAVVSLASGPYGTVYATGRFSTIGSRQIEGVARYRTNSWQPLPDELDGDVASIVFDSNGVAYFGGNFTVTTTSQTISNLAKFDGTSWSAMPAAVPGDVVALAMGPNDTLYAATSVAGGYSVHEWSGSSWQQLGASFSRTVGAMAVLPNGDLYIGGQFDQDNNGTALAAVARWDGSDWADVGGGLGQMGYVSEMTVYDGKLLVVGHFGEVGGQTAGSVALWDGSTWDTLGGGLPPRFPNGPAPTVSAVVAKVDGFFVSGTFETVGSTAVNHIAWYDGQDWYALGDGIDDLGETMAISDHQLFVGGPFTTAGGQPSYHIGVWDYRP